MTPDLQIHFLLNKIDNIYSDSEVKRVIHDTQTRINAYFPYARVFPYSSLYTNSQQLHELTDLFILTLSIKTLTRTYEKDTIFHPKNNSISFG